MNSYTFWKLFAATGSISAYLGYRESQELEQEELTEEAMIQGG